MTLKIEISEQEPGVYLVIPEGEINTQTCSILETKVMNDVVPKAKAVIIEMGKVSYISSMGLSTIFRIKLAMEGRQGTMALVNMQPKVQEVFETMKILSPQMFATLHEADEYMDGFLDKVQKGIIKPRKPQE